MERTRKTAGLAPQILATGTAEQDRRVAAPVAQQDRLVARRQGASDLGQQPLGEPNLAAAAWPLFLPKVDQDALG